MTRKVRIVSDGNSLNTKILDAENGENLTPMLMVQRVEIDVQDIIARATLLTVSPSMTSFARR